MASSKFLGCDIINLEEDEVHDGSEGGGTVAQEVSRSGFPPVGEAMSPSVCFPLCNQREIGGFDSGSVSMDSGIGFIDFFDRESVEKGGEFFFNRNQRESTSGDSNLWSFYEDIDLALGIGSGSGSGQVRGEDSVEVIHISDDSSPVEVCVEEEAMVTDEQQEWEDLQNDIGWVEESSPFQVRFFGEEEEEDGDVQDQSRADNWEVLLDVSNSNGNGIEEDMMVMDIDFNFLVASVDEFDVGFNGEFFLDGEVVTTGSPPASKKVVEDLPVVEITSEELRDGNIVCAICKDDVLVEEKVKMLPCKHYYHGECIVPWLGIRNTCPVCRYELPTDDLEYERNRSAQSRGLVADLMSQ